MSLTSYRAAPPRGKGLVRTRAAIGELGRPGGDLLFHALRRSTIGAEGFHGRVRDGIGCFAPRYGHQTSQVLSLKPITRTDWPGEGASDECVTENVSLVE